MKEKLFNNTASYNPTVWKPQDTLVQTVELPNKQLRPIVIVLRLCFIYFYHF